MSGLFVYPATGSLIGRKCRPPHVRGQALSATAVGQSIARILGAIEGLFVSYGQWPSVVRLPPSYIEHLQNQVLSAEAFAKLTEKITLVPDASATVIAENSNGQFYNYSLSGFHKTKPPIRAREWLGLGNL